MDASLLLLFFSAFLAATILPFSSEVVLATVIAAGAETAWVPVAVATLGNTLGAVVNWWLGRYLAHYQGHKWFPLTPQRYDQASGWFQRFGVWSLLLAWVPIIGDPLTLVAGLFRVRFWVFLPLVAIGKGLRYLAVAGLISPFT